MIDLLERLRGRNVEFDVVEYSDQLFTTEAVATAAKLPARLVAKAMLVKVAGDYRIVVVPGNRRVDISALGTLLGGTARFAERSQVATITGVPVGAITPLIALARPHIRVIMDKLLMSEMAINISSGRLTCGLNISPEALCAAVDAQIANISSSA